jgi:hypothetical protein
MRLYRNYPGLWQKVVQLRNCLAVIDALHVEAGKRLGRLVCERTLPVAVERRDGCAVLLRAVMQGSRKSDAAVDSEKACSHCQVQNFADPLSDEKDKSSNKE